MPFHSKNLSIRIQLGHLSPQLVAEISNATSRGDGDWTMIKGRIPYLSESEFLLFPDESSQTWTNDFKVVMVEEAEELTHAPATFPPPGTIPPNKLCK